MQHGDIQVQISLSGEPQKLLTYWRGSLRDVVPTSASVAILRPWRKGRYNDYYDPSVYLDGMTRTEKKRAELSISDKSLSMDAGEIAIARELTDLLYDWLSRRKPVPACDRAISNSRIDMTFIEGPDAVGIVESFGDPEVLSRAVIGAVYLQGEPRRPDIRWLPPMDGLANKAAALKELQVFEGALADGQAAAVRDVVQRLGGVFRKRADQRKLKLHRRYTEVFGVHSEVRIRGQCIDDDMVESYRYRDILAWLDDEAKGEKSRGKIRTWRPD